MQSRCIYCLVQELWSSVQYQPFSFGNDIFADMHLYGEEHICLFIYLLLTSCPVSVSLVYLEQ